VKNPQRKAFTCSRGDFPRNPYGTSAAVQISAPFATAASWVPSELDAIPFHHLEPAAVWSVQVAPESVEVQMSPLLTLAARWVPSDLEAIDFRSREPAAVRSVQVAPESVEVQISPLCAAAARWVPSELDAIEFAGAGLTDSR